MKRKSLQAGLDPEQLPLFNLTRPDKVRPAAASWVAQHWPDHVARAADVPEQPPAAGALLRWVEATPELSKGQRALLCSLSRKASGAHSECRSNLLDLARANAISQNSCKRYLEKLVAAGLLMAKPWKEPGGGILGYEFRLIAHVEDRAAAAAEGFSSSLPKAECLLWAKSCHHLPPAARGILNALAARADAAGAGCFNVAAFAEELDVSRNKLKRFLDRLLGAGLVMLKPLTSPTGRMFLGYQFRLIDSAERGEAAAREGFVAHRESDSRLGRV